MSILYTVIARETTILAKYACCAGNFQQVSEQVLEKIATCESSKMTYTHGSYLFHYWRDNHIVYMAITEEGFERSRAFTYLADIKRRFQNMFGKFTQTALPYAMDTEFAGVLMAQMKRFSKPTDQQTKVEEVQGQLGELKDIMVQNIDSVAARGENLSLLVDKTEDLSDSSGTFLKQSTSLRRALWWKNFKITIFIIVILFVLVFIIVTAACGGFSYPHCSH